MITAKEAYRKVLFRAKLKKQMDNIEKYINKAIEHNRMCATIPYNGNLSNSELFAIREELERLGYTVEYTPVQPLPSGCPVDQWSFDSYLKVSWGKED